MSDTPIREFRVGCRYVYKGRTEVWCCESINKQTGLAILRSMNTGCIIQQGTEGWFCVYEAKEGPLITHLEFVNSALLQQMSMISPSKSYMIEALKGAEMSGMWVDEVETITIPLKAKRAVRRATLLQSVSLD